MKIYNNNINQHIRDYLSQTLDYSKSTKQEKNYHKDIMTIMNGLKEKDNNLYKNVLSVAFVDYYKILYNKKIDGSINIEEEGSLLFFDLLKSIETVYQELEILPELAIDFVDKSLEFNNLNYFEKRKIFTNLKEKNSYLQKLCPGHFIDQLFYCQRYDTDKFIDIYKKSLKNSKNADENTKKMIKENAIENLTNTYEELKKYDFPNIETLGYAMIRDYYIHKKFEAKDNTLNNVDSVIIKKLEKNKLENLDILSDFYDESIITKTIIKGFLEYNTETNEKYKNEAREYLNNNISTNIKTKLRYKN